MARRLRHTTALVYPLALGIVIAVVGLGSLNVRQGVENACANLIFGSGVVGDSVVVGLGPHLIDIDLAIHGPVVADHPESGPSTTDRLGEVAELGNEQTGVVGRGTLETNTLAGGVRGRAVDTNGDIITLGLDQTRGQCRTLAHVVDISIVGIHLGLIAATLYSRFVSIALSLIGFVFFPLTSKKVNLSTKLSEL